MAQVRQLKIPHAAFFNPKYLALEFQNKVYGALQYHTSACVAEYCGVARSVVYDWVDGRGLKTPYAITQRKEITDWWLRCLGELAACVDCPCMDGQKLDDWRQDFNGVIIPAL